MVRLMRARPLRTFMASSINGLSASLRMPTDSHLEVGTRSRIFSLSKSMTYSSSLRPAISCSSMLTILPTRWAGYTTYSLALNFSVFAAGFFGLGIGMLQSQNPTTPFGPQPRRVILPRVLPIEDAKAKKDPSSVARLRLSGQVFQHPERYNTNSPFFKGAYRKQNAAVARSDQHSEALVNELRHSRIRQASHRSIALTWFSREVFLELVGLVFKGFCVSRRWL